MEHCEGQLLRPGVALRASRKTYDFQNPILKGATFSFIPSLISMLKFGLCISFHWKVATETLKPSFDIEIRHHTNDTETSKCLEQGF